MGPPSRSFAADAHDCIMVRICIGSTEYKCVARCSAPDGELPSDHHADRSTADPLLLRYATEIAVAIVQSVRWVLRDEEIYSDEQF